MRPFSVLDVQVITITFNRLDLEDTGNCVADSVSLYDGADTTGRLLGKFCGDELPDELTSSGHYVYVVFRTNRKRNVGGFSLSWSAIDAHGTDNAAPGINVILYYIAYSVLLNLLSC